MKNLLLLSAFLVTAFFSNAQFTTGQKMLGVQLGISSSNNQLASPPGMSSSSFFVNFSLTAWRFTSPTVITGTGLSYSYSRYRNFYGSPATERIEPTHSVGGFFNRTKLEPLAKKFYFTYTGTIGANFGASRPYFVPSGASDTQSEYYGVYISGGVGLLYQLNERFLATCELGNIFNLGYQHSVATSYATPTTTYKNVSNQVNLSTNLAGFNLSSMMVGVRYMLKK